MLELKEDNKLYGKKGTKVGKSFLSMIPKKHHDLFKEVDKKKQNNESINKDSYSFHTNEWKGYFVERNDLVADIQNEREIENIELAGVVIERYMQEARGQRIFFRNDRELNDDN